MGISATSRAQKIISKSFSHLAILVVLGLIASRPVHAAAKTLPGRLGFGFTNLGTGLTPALSLDWISAVASSLDFQIGLDTQQNQNLMILGTRYFRNLFLEDNMNYGLYVGGGLISQQVAGAGQSGYYVETGAGAKFFLGGLPNLGFHAGSGLRVESTNQMRLRTNLFVGMHYYF